MAKLTDQEIEEARTRRTMIVTVSGYDWAMTHEDALAMLSIFARSRKVEQIHSSSYRRSVYIEAEDQSPPIDGATIGNVRVHEKADAVDQFSAATRAVS